MPDSEITDPSTDQAVNDPGPEVDGPVFVPIFPSTAFFQPVTEFSTLPVTLSLPPEDATESITIAYYNNSTMTTANVANMPTPAWDSNGQARFDLIVDQELMDALGSNTATLLVQSVSGDHQCTFTVDIDIQQS